ncbi:acyl protein synthase/acyl-CoA reductase RfbN [Xenorhabdus stockiae]|uniref:Acyl protein synthase/acyl-CoA reductase RfbN n=1 Tax=Xenorhabdus stockiae TaxID=351614 RepID=A0A2D0KBF3_9GAMM|nr:LuxE family acyl-protein synthetase [Xenorhabdus stockiae]PHM60733.1 acyl protein synthase/acyl-CoA reductase RfbN [Xenorhabdus stockiae]
MPKAAELYESIKDVKGDAIKWIVTNSNFIYSLPVEEQQELKTHIIRDAFKYHFENNIYYRQQCEEKGVRPDDIQNYKELVKIPVIPVSTFKSADSHRLLSKPLSSIEHEMRSTGTSGIPSVARRCDETMDYATIALYNSYRDMLKLSSGAGLCLCPSTEEIPEMGMIKAFNWLAGLLDTNRFMVKEERFVPEESINQLNEWQGKFTRYVIGPPFLIHRFISFLKATNTKLKLDSESMVITLGGWKRFTGAMISRTEFNQEVETWLGISANRIRDMYGLVEANFLAIEDEFNQKHIPPYIHFSVRDPENLSREVEDGEIGQLVILDPIARSTPGMLLTEDMIYLRTDSDPSGRNSQRMQYVMRAPSATEFGCCAVNLERKIANDEQKDACPVIR